MTDANNTRPDVLEAAIEALRHEPVPPGPPPDLAAATVRLLETSTDPPEVLRRNERKARMIRIARYSSLSAAALALAAFIGWFAFLNGTSTVAFADVIKNVQEAESVTLVNRQKLGDQPEFQFKLSIQGHHFRMDVPGAFTYIADLTKKKALQIDHAKKIAYNVPVSDEMVKRMGNPIDQFRKLRPQDAKRQADEKLNGKTTYVYVVDKIDFFGFKGKGEIKIWVDPKTKLPLKIRVKAELPPAAKAADRRHGMRSVYEDFQWNKKLDPKLFELKAPKGYKVQEGGPGPKRGK